jgi:hypothetical protein
MSGATQCDPSYSVWRRGRMDQAQCSQRRSQCCPQIPIVRWRGEAEYYGGGGEKRVALRPLSEQGRQHAHAGSARWAGGFVSRRRMLQSSRLAAAPLPAGDSQTTPDPSPWLTRSDWCQCVADRTTTAAPAAPRAVASIREGQQSIRMRSGDHIASALSLEDIARRPRSRARPALRAQPPLAPIRWRVAAAT